MAEVQAVDLSKCTRTSMIVPADNVLDFHTAAEPRTPSP